MPPSRLSPHVLRRLCLPLLALVAACVFGAASASAAALLPHSTPALSVKITKRPLAYSRSASPTFAWKKVSATKTMCKLDARPFAKCGTQIVYKKLLAGKHSFWVRVYRGTKTKTLLVRWVIDVKPPTAPVVTGGSATWVRTPVVIHATGSTDTGGSGVASYQYRESTNGGLSWAPIVTGTSATVTKSGSTWVQFRGVDRAGNVSPWSPVAPDAASSVLLDNTAPTLPILSGGGAAWVQSGQVDVTATGAVDVISNPVTYEYRTSTDNGTTWILWTPGTDAAVTAEGKTLVQFHAVDALGNVTTPVQTPVWIDRTAPTDPAVTGGSAGWQNAASVKLTASGAADSGSGIAGYRYETSSDGGGSWSAPTTAASATITAEGQTLVRFQAFDASGLTSDWVQSPVAIDRSAPTAPAVTGGSATWQNVASLAMMASGSADAGSGVTGYQYETSVNGTTWTAPVAGSSATISAEGRTYVQFRAVDAVGNVSPWSSAMALIDRTAPTDPVITGVSAGVGQHVVGDRHGGVGRYPRIGRLLLRVRALDR